MREFRNSIHIAASWDRIWQILSDFERWPEWTQSVSQIKRLTAGPTGVGSRFLICQPRMRPTVWTVTWWEPGRRFVWTAGGIGLTMFADHAIVADEAGCMVYLNHSYQGFFEPIVDAVSGRTLSQFLVFEAAGLKARSEWR